MQLFTFIIRIVGLLALLSMVSCTMNDEIQTCTSDSECPSSHYCAQGGGVFFTASQCVKRSSQSTADDTDQLDALPPTSEDTSEDTTLHDALSPDDTDTNPPADTETDATPPLSCTENSDCNDDISCTQDACVDGLCQNSPDDSQCDDGNVCTDNRCDTNLGCTTSNNNAPCDDGFFCNGNDMCANGVCSFHQGTTCPDGICNETLQNCTECSQNSECGEPNDPIESDCVFESTCTSNGTRTLTYRTPTCENNTCIILEETLNQFCTRPMPSGACGAPTTSDWGDCDFGTNTCATTGTQSRTITTPTCSNNICLNNTTTETQACTRPNPTGKCKADSITWTPCAGPTDCSQSGTRSKSVTTWACNADQCQPTTLLNVETQSCTLNTNGNACTAGSHSGSCINGCCEPNCPQGQPCLQCILE